MEYSLLIDKKRKYLFFKLAIAGTVLFTIASLFTIGFYGFMGVAVLLFFTAISPLLIGRYKFFLIAWLFIIPLCDSLFWDLMIAGTFPQVILMTGLTLPFGIILFLTELPNVIKKYPYIKYLIMFFFVVFLNVCINFFSGRGSLGNFNDVFKIFLQIFIITCFYKYTLKNTNISNFVNWTRIFFIANSCTAILQRLTGIGLPIIEGVPRVVGLCGHPNVLAFINVIYFPFALHYLLKSKDKTDKTWWIISILTGVMALILTMCKSVIFTFLVQLFILFFFVNMKTKVKVAFSIIGAALLFIAANYLLDLQIIELIINRINNTSSYESRLILWNYLLSNINMVNIWLGHGIDSAFLKIHQMTGGHTAPHNAYLQMLYELGIIGLLFFLLSFIVYSLKFIKLFIKEKTSYKIHYILPLLIIISILIDMTISNNVLLRTPMIFAYFFLTVFYRELILKVPDN